MGGIKKKHDDQTQSTVIATSWDSWEPGNKAAATTATSGQWLLDGFVEHEVVMPLASREELDAVVKIVSEEMSKGSAEAACVKRIKIEVGLNAEISRTLAHFGMSLSAVQSSLENFLDSGVENVKWLGGCCEFCDTNDNLHVPINTPFPTGHFLPPACDYCICALSPYVVY